MFLTRLCSVTIHTNCGYIRPDWFIHFFIHSYQLEPWNILRVRCKPAFHDYLRPMKTANNKNCLQMYSKASGKSLLRLLLIIICMRLKILQKNEIKCEFILVLKKLKCAFSNHFLKTPYRPLMTWCTWGTQSAAQDHITPVTFLGTADGLRVIFTLLNCGEEIKRRI